MVNMKDKELINGAKDIFNECCEWGDFFEMHTEFEFHRAVGALEWTKQEAREWLESFILENKKRWEQ